MPTLFRFGSSRSRNKPTVSRPASDAVPIPGRRREGIEESARLERRRRVAGHVRGALLLVTFLTATLTAFLGDRGYLDVRRSQHELKALEAEVADRRERVQRLQEHARRLRSDPQAVERIAREELNRILPGETVFLLPREQGPAGFPADPELRSDP